MKKYAGNLRAIGFNNPKKPNDNWVFLLIAGAVIVLAILVYSLLK